MQKYTRAALAAIAISICGCDDGGAHAVAGTITLAPDRMAKMGASDTLFILARPAGEKGGPPLAVLKMVGMKFPLKYELGQEDVLMPGKFFTGKVEVQAVLRRSGIATLPVPGDVRGVHAQPVEPGAKGVDIALDTPDEGPVKASR
ncbi:MAG: c-type cytochrome biosis protein CcmI [Cyanobacteria bacterium RYN_339]|nr:c-type cytochrome biosis protein CcmI [Cyanobacteria bacterium RYN_339]